MAQNKFDDYFHVDFKEMKEIVVQLNKKKRGLLVMLLVQKR